MFETQRIPLRNIWCFLSVAVGLLVLAAPAPTHAADTCANAAFRPGTAANLPDCRAWEQVSPKDKGGNDVVSTSAVASVAGGDKVYFNASGAINNPDAVLYDTAYLASRGADWSTRGLDPPLTPSGFLIKGTVALSEDGTKAVVATTRALTPGAIEGGSNVYIRDLTQQSSYRLVAAAQGRQLFENLTGFGNQGVLLGYTSDLSTLALESTQPLTPDAPDPAANNNRLLLYLWRDGELRLASKLANGTTVGAGLDIPQPAYDRSFLSTDGLRVTFRGDVTTDTQAIYQYVWGESARLISRSYRQSGDPDQPVPAVPFVSPDGRTIFFSLNGQLTDDPDDVGNSLYRWSADAPDDLEVAAQGADLIYDVSPDERYVWFLQYDAGTVRLVVLDLPAGTRRTVASFDPTREPAGPSPLSGTALSPDGHTIIFQSYTNLTGVPNESAVCRTPGNAQNDGNCANIYSYDADAPSEPVKCLSCVPGTRNLGNAFFNNSSTFFSGRRARPVTDDGRVFFDTPNRLVASDTNAVSDVYEYKPGAGVRLLSTGSSGSPAFFQDTSEDARDVFFVTAGRLVPQDVDSLADLYVARRGGGIASQQVAPAATGGGCSGEACRPDTSGPLVRPVPGTAAFEPPATPVFAKFSYRGFSARSARALARGSSVTLPVKVAAAGRVSAVLTGRLGGRTRVAGSASGRASKAGTVRLKLKLNGRARAALRRSGRLRLRLTVRYSKGSKAATTTLTVTRRGGAR